MTLDAILKNLDPIISQTLDRALSNKDISVEQGTELLDSNGTEMNMILRIADELRQSLSARFSPWQTLAGGELEIFRRGLHADGQRGFVDRRSGH